MSCGYQGKHFGASYEDAVCIEGYLWDLDSCGEPDGYLCFGGEIPCPRCNTRKYVSEFHVAGNAHQRRKMRREYVRKVLQWASKSAIVFLKEK